MESNNLDEKIEGSFPILSDTAFPSSWIKNNFKIDDGVTLCFNKLQEQLHQFCREIIGGNFYILPFVDFYSIYSSFPNLDKICYYHRDSIYSLFELLLNVEFKGPGSSYDKSKIELRKKLNEFSKIKDVNSLKNKFSYFYKKVYLNFLEMINHQLIIHQRVYMEYKKLNRNERRKMKLDSEQSSWFMLFDFLTDFPKFIQYYYQILNRLINNIDKIVEFINSHGVVINYKNELEYKKFDLLVAIVMYFDYKYFSKDDKKLLYIKDYFDRNKDINDDSIKLTITESVIFSGRISSDDNNKSYVFTPQILYGKYLELIKEKEYIKEFSLSDFSNMSVEQILEYVDSLLNDLKNNFKKISLEDVQKKLKQIMENSDKTEVSKQKLESLIRKIDFLLNHRPISIIKGEETFNNYFGYIYSNGYVVLDYISSDVERSYGHALYVIHISDLKKYSKLSLSELRKNHSDKIISIVHSSKWEDKLESILSSNIDSTTLTVSSEMDQIDMATTLAELEYLKNNLAVVNEEVEKKLKEKEVKIKKIKQYDEEIKQTPVEENLSDEDKEELLEAEIDLLANSGNSSDFVSLHEKALEKKYKVKRNPDVSLKTKLRTLDENGAFHCDFCNSPSFALDLYDAHHIIPISKGGIDNVYNTTCLCPSCHRKFHSKIPPTFAERGLLLQRVRERILESTPEYLPNFDALFNPNYHNDIGLSESDLLEKYKQEEDYYSTHKEEEDQKFLVDWNTHHR